jgi:hypothetical protein
MLVSLGIMLLGALTGLVIAFIIAVLLPGPQPWLLVAGLVLGGFVALQRRKVH